MGMDSAEIVICWEESLCVAVPDELAAKVTTPEESIQLLASLVQVRAENGACLNQKAFNLVRNILINDFNISRSQIKTTSRFSTLFPKKGQRNTWANFKNILGMNDLSVVLGFPLFAAGSTKIEDVITEIVARKASCLIEPAQGWAISQLREVVRASVTYVTGATEFSDDDHYVYDIGID